MDYKGTKKVLMLMLIVTRRYILNCKDQKMSPDRILKNASDLVKT